MIYLDSSVALAHLLSREKTVGRQGRCGPTWLDDLQPPARVRALAWCRLPARDLASSHGDAARQLLSRISFIELSPLVLGRALEPFPAPVRTLDALHLAALEFLRARRLEVRLATYDRRMTAVAQAMSIPLLPLP